MTAHRDQRQLAALAANELWKLPPAADYLISPATRRSRQPSALYPSTGRNT